MPPFALVDTSFLLGVIDRRDPHHRHASAYYRAIEGNALFPAAGLAELAYHMHQIGGGRLVATTLELVRKGPLGLVDLTELDYDRAAEILRQYHDSRIDFVDASIMALAERLNITRILTYDHRDFRLFKPAHVESFTILP